MTCRRLPTISNSQVTYWRSDSNTGDS